MNAKARLAKLEKAMPTKAIPIITSERLLAGIEKARYILERPQGFTPDLQAVSKRIFEILDKAKARHNAR